MASIVSAPATNAATFTSTPHHRHESPRLVDRHDLGGQRRPCRGKCTLRRVARLEREQRRAQNWRRRHDLNVRVWRRVREPTVNALEQPRITARNDATSYHHGDGSCGELETTHRIDRQRHNLLRLPVDNASGDAISCRRRREYHWAESREAGAGQTPKMQRFGNLLNVRQAQGTGDLL